MGRVVVSEFVSIDGVVEAPGGEPGYRHTNWVSRFPDAGQFDYKFEEVRNAHALLLGRTTYESFAGAWPSYEGEFADRMNAMPKYVVTRSLNQLAWNNASVLADLVEVAVPKLKAEVEGDLLVNGSRTLVNSLRQFDLVDEYRLMVFPIVLGSGLRLFEQSPDAAEFALSDVRSWPNGIVNLIYTRQPAGEA